jgi:NADPH:quinone reductase-like Zn-dependent oxidoreductase
MMDPMRAFAVPRYGEAPALLDIPDPTPADALLVDIAFAGANPVDYKRLDGLDERAHFPYVVGQDFSGVATSVPPDERELHVGDRIFGVAASSGTYAERTIVPSNAGQPTARIPDGVTDAQAAGLPTPALTALAAVEELAIEAGMTFVVLGAAGVVGGYAVQIACARGAHAIGIVRGGRIDDTRALGAAEVYDVGQGDPRAAIRRAHPDGVDAILDTVSGREEFAANAELVRSGGGMISIVGGADPAALAARGIRAANMRVANTPLWSREGLGTVARMVAGGTISVRIAADFDLGAAGEVLHKMRSGGLNGKAVLHVRAPADRVSAVRGEYQEEGRSAARSERK